jgi:hypothetical protein
MLCPILVILPFGIGVVMRRADPTTVDEAQQLLDGDEFPDWDYMPPSDDSCPFEYKASDWGRLPDGRLVALDYSAIALSDPEELTRRSGREVGGAGPLPKTSAGRGPPPC